MWYIYVSKSGEVIEATVDLLLSIVGRTATPEKEPAFQMLCREAFPSQLAALLQTRFNLEDCRYHPALLGKVASLMLKLSCHKPTLKILMDNDCIENLIFMVKNYKQYDTILLQVTACIGTMYVNAGKELFKRYAVEEEKGEKKKARVNPLEQIKPDDDAIILVTTLHEFKTLPERALLLLNILIAVRYLVRTDNCPPEEKIRRHYLLALLYAEHNLDTAMKQCKETASQSSKAAENSKASTELQRNQDIIAMSVINKVKWFKKQKKEIADVLDTVQHSHQ